MDARNKDWGETDRQPNITGVHDINGSVVETSKALVDVLQPIVDIRKGAKRRYGACQIKVDHSDHAALLWRVGAPTSRPRNWASGNSSAISVGLVYGISGWRRRFSGFDRRIPLTGSCSQVKNKLWAPWKSSQHLSHRTYVICTDGPTKNDMLDDLPLQRYAVSKFP